MDRKIKGDQNSRHGNRCHPFTLLDQIGIISRIESSGEIIVLELALIGERQKLETGLPPATHERIHWLRRNENDSRYVPFTHLLKRDLMRNERLFHVEAETAEDQRSRIGGSGALRVEIHLLPDEVVEALDLGP